jgi:hypothetical protein
MSPREPLRPLHPEIVRRATVATPTSLGRWLGGALNRFLSRRRHAHGVSLPTDPAHLAACLKPGDVFLVEGESRLSVGNKWRARRVDAQGWWHDPLGGQRIRIQFHAQARSAEAYDASGRLLPTVTAFCFAWVAFHPGTDLPKE